MITSNHNQAKKLILVYHVMDQAKVYVLYAKVQEIVNTFVLVVTVVGLVLLLPLSVH